MNSNSNGKAVAISTIGYMCLAIAGWMISMTYASWFPGQSGMVLLYPFAIVLGVMGILSFVQNRWLDAIVFFGGTAMLGSAYAYDATVTMAKVADPNTYLAWFALLWAIFFAYVWVGSFKSGVVRMLFLLGMWLTMLALAIGGWSGVHGWMVLAGYIGLATSILAGITSASEIIRFGTIGNPNVEAPRANPNVEPPRANPNVEPPRAFAAD